MKFKPGQSGNPNGRKKGSQNQRTQLSKLLEPHAPELVNKIVELAKDGDINALRFCLERLIPKAKNEPLQFIPPMQDLSNANNLVAMGQNIISALSNQKITSEQAKEIFQVLDIQRKNIEAFELEEKFSKLEAIVCNLEKLD